MQPINVQQLLFRTRFFIFTKFSMLDGSHLDVQRKIVVHLFKCVLNLGPRAVNTIQALRCLNPALVQWILLLSFTRCHSPWWKPAVSWL